jgi:16S rRNA (uracil1498-N3)-methyltransferase
MHRFHCPDLDSLTLPPEESHHATAVLRLAPGDALTVFDGRGREARALVTEASKTALRFSILSRHQSPTPAFTLRLVQAIPKAKAMDLILQKTTELGVRSIHPILSDRSVVRLEEGDISTKADKWNQTVLEACKQCGQNHLPEVHPAQSVAAFLETQRAWGGLKIIASLQPEARPLRQLIQDARAAGPYREATLVIGPEGDFTPAEIGAFRGAGYLPASLGPTILRTETAAIFSAGILLYEAQA